MDGKFNFPEKRKLFRSITISLVVLAICLVVMAEASYIISSKTINRLAAENYQLVTAEKTQAASEWFVEQKTVLLTQAATLETLGVTDHRYLSDYFENYINNYADAKIFDIYVLSPNNEMSGGIGYENLIEDPDFDYRERAWYSSAIDNDNVHYSTAYIDKVSGDGVITVSKRINLSGTYYVLGIDVFTTSLEALFSDSRLGQNSYSFIVDDEYEAINHPGEAFAYEDSPVKMNSLGVSGYAELVLAMENDEEGLKFVDYDGVERQFYFETINEGNWRVVSAVETNVSEEEMFSLRQTFFTSAVLILIISLAIELFFRILSSRRVYKNYINISEMAYKDQMTGAYNWRVYDDTINEILLKGYDEDLIIMICDVNGLKKINDTYGHLAGNEIIVGAAECLKHVFDSYGKVCRTGGDEFTIIMTAKGFEMDYLMDRLNERISAWHGELISTLSMSVGYVFCKDHKGQPIEEILAMADEAMYKNKAEYYKQSPNDRRRS